MRVVEYAGRRVTVPRAAEDVYECVRELPFAVVSMLAGGELPGSKCRLCETFNGLLGIGAGNGVGAGRDWPEAAIRLHAYHNAAECPGSALGPDRTVASVTMSLMLTRCQMVYEVAKHVAREYFDGRKVLCG